MTPAQLATLDAIRAHIETFGYGPTLTEIGEKLGRSKVTMHKHVAQLVWLGKLRKTSNRKRGIELVGGVDLRSVPLTALRAELARRGETLGALDRDRPASMARGTAHCAADGCQMGVRRGHLMCFRHWSLLPFDLRRGLLGAHARRDLPEFSALLVKARDIAAEERA